MKKIFFLNLILFYLLLLYANPVNADTTLGSGYCTEVVHSGGGWWCDYWNFSGVAGGGPSCSRGHVTSQGYSSRTGNLISFSCVCSYDCPVNGACSATHYGCSAGTLGATAEYPNAWQWWCNGAYGGGNNLCTEYKPVDNGCAYYTSACTTCWNNISWVSGAVSCNTACSGKVCAVDNGCAANTCAGQICWNSYQYVNGTKSCLVNNASFSSGSVPSTVAPGSSFIAHIAMKNTGTTNWVPTAPAPYNYYRLGSANPRDNYVWGINRITYNSTVFPGDTAVFTIYATAPATPGTYNFQWQMLQEYVEWFGPATDNYVVNVIAPKPHISLSPESLSFSGTSGGTIPPSQTLTISNPSNAALNWVGSTNQNWCHLSSTSGSIGAGSSRAITISVDAPSNIGSFGCNITISDSNADNSPKYAGVTYTVSAPATYAAVISWNPMPGATYYNLRINNTSNDSPGCTDGWYCGDPPDRIVNNYTSTSYTFSSAIVGRDYNWWVHACNSSGCSSPSSGSFNFSSCIPLPPSVSKPHISLAPSSFYFSGTSGGTIPPSQTLTISNTGNSSLNWTASTNQNWCHLAQSSGNINSGNNKKVNITVDSPSNVGTFSCAITVSDSSADNSPQTAGVTYAVSLAPNINYTLNVSKSGTGSGVVSGSGINCGPTCSSSYTSGTSVTLTASPSYGSTFTGWSGDCSGGGNCSIIMNAAKSVTANFISAPSSVLAPGSFTLSLGADGAASCNSVPLSWTSSNSAIGYRILKGSPRADISPHQPYTALNYSDTTVSPNTTYNYQIEAYNGDGSTRSNSLNVTTPYCLPTLSFSASPTALYQGQSSTLTWTSFNTTSCSASGSWSGSKSINGNAVVIPSIPSSTYNLVCTGPGGTVSQSVTVTVGPLVLPDWREIIPR